MEGMQGLSSGAKRTAVSRPTISAAASGNENRVMEVPMRIAGQGSNASLSIALAGICGILLGGAGAAHATTIEHRSFNELVLKADLVAVARVNSVDAYPTTDGRYAYTYTELGDLEVLKGSYASATLTLRSDGGPLGDGRVLVVAGEPQFVPDERVVVFVRGNTERICPLVGWGQGVFRVERSRDGATEVVTTDSHRAIRAVRDGELVVADDRVASSAPGAETGADAHAAGAHAESGELTLDGLRNEIHSLLAAAGADAETHAIVATATLKVDGPGALPDRTSDGRN
jgi:hypothetical protein